MRLVLDIAMWGQLSLLLMFTGTGSGGAQTETMGFPKLCGKHLCPDCAPKDPNGNNDLLFDFYLNSHKSTSSGNKQWFIHGLNNSWDKGRKTEIS